MFFTAFATLFIKEARLASSIVFFLIAGELLVSSDHFSEKSLET